MSWNIAKPGDQINGPVAVTGNLNVDSNTLFVDSANNRVGVLTASPTVPLDVVGDAKVSGNLTVDTNTLVVDAANNRLGIGTATPEQLLHLYGAAPRAIIENSANNGIYLRLKRPNKEYIVALDINNNGGNDFTIWDNTAAASRFSIASDGVCTWSNVGGVAGTAMTLNGTGLGVGVSPLARVHSATNIAAANHDWTSQFVAPTVGFLAASNDSSAWIRIATYNSNPTHDPYLNFLTAGGQNWSIGIDNSDSDKLKVAMAAGFNGSNEFLTIDSTGNVGIGTTSPSVKVQVDNNGQSEVRIRNTSGSGIAALALVAGAQQSNPWYLYADSSRNLIFQDGGSERARIDSTGNFGIGTSPAAFVRFHSSDSQLNTYNYFQNNQALAVNRSVQIVLANGTTAFGANNRDWRFYNVATSATASNFVIDYWNGTAIQSRLAIDSSGNLSVGGTPTGTGKFEIQGTTVGERILFSQTANNTAARTMFSIGYRSGGTNTTGYNAIVCATETQFDDSYGVKILSGPSSAVGIHLNKDGRVGIGMADSMLNRAQIQGAGQATATVSDNGDGSALFLSDTGAAANNGGLLFLGSASTNGQRPHVGIKSLLNDGTANGTGDMAFLTRTTTGATTLTEKMRLTTAGFLGVGMTPVAPLSVRNSSGGFLFNFDRNSGAKLRLECDTDAAATGALLYVVNSAASAYQPLRIDASVIRLKPNGIESMTIKGGGQTQFVPLASAPASPEAGDVYYDSSTNKLRCYNGTTWNDLF